MKFSESMLKDVKFKLLWPMTAHGVTFEEIGGTGQAIGNCPFCGRDGHFIADPESGQYSCKNCGRGGNSISFLGQYMEFRREETTTKDLQKLEALRGIPWKAFKKHGVAWDGTFYLIPCCSSKGTVRDVRRWRPPKSKMLMATKGCATQLWGAERLVKADQGSRVWICEGEWDGLALAWIIEQAHLPDVVVACPGADTFKREWRELFRGMNVVVLGDNDDAGDKFDARVGKSLRGWAKSIQYLLWPEQRDSGWDVRDQVSAMLELEKGPREIVAVLLRLLGNQHRHKSQDPEQGEAIAAEAAEGEWKPFTLPQKKIPLFKEVVQVFKKSGVQMSKDMVDGLRVILATIVSEQIPGDPLWFYVVGPAGSGKTLLLSATQSSDRTIFRSTVTPNSIVSGFKGPKDPSLLAMVNKRTLVFKDGTVLLSLPVFEQDEIYGIFRDAYDGYVNRSFGNGETREYHLHFSMLIGVTDSIYANNRASLGERFLKFHMPVRGNRDEQIYAALDNTSEEKRIEEAIQEITNRFLARESVPKAVVPEWVKQRLVALSQLISLLRATLDKDKFTGEVLVRPYYEVGTRLGKQLMKFGMALTVVDGDSEIGYKQYALMERVAFDTAIGFHRDIVRVMGEEKRPMQKLEIHAKTKIPVTTLTRNLEDLVAIGVVGRRKLDAHVSAGRPPDVYFIRKRVRKLWKRAGVGEPPKELEYDARKADRRDSRGRRHHHVGDNGWAERLRDSGMHERNHNGQAQN